MTKYRCFFYSTLICVLLLCGCSNKSPTETIISEHIQIIDDTIDYAKNNIMDTDDTRFLLSALNTCRVGLVSASQSYSAEIDTCQLRTDYWQMVSVVLGAILIAIITNFLIKHINKRV